LEITGTTENGRKYVVERDDAPGYPESFGVEDDVLC
jgi:hypothetical protein